MRAVLIIAAMFLAGPAHAVLAPELEVETLSQVTAALDAPLDPLEGEGPGFLMLGRDVVGGESARRVETCRTVNQARAEGFTKIDINRTAFFADWLVVRCQVLGLLEGASALGESGLSADWAVTAPALFSSRIGCIGSYRATAAALKGLDWSRFEQEWRSTFSGADAGPVRFVLLDSEAALNGFDEPGAIGVLAQNDLQLLVRDGALKVRIELLASADLNGDGLDEWIMLHQIEDELSAIEDWRVHVLTQSDAGPVLHNPAKAIEDVLMACPDQLGSLLADPCLIEADQAE